MQIHIETAERDESLNLPYFPGQEPNHPAAYPLPHLVDAFVAHRSPIEERYLEPCKAMLRTGWVPDSIGKPGSPPIGIKIDPELARKVLTDLP